MSVERRGQVIRVSIMLVNWQQEEPTDCGEGRQLLMDDTSRVSREAQARFREGLGVQFPGATRPSTEIRTCRKYLDARRLSGATCSPVDTHPDSRPRQSQRAREKSTASTIEETRMTPTQTELSCFALFAIFTLWCK